MNLYINLIDLVNDFDGFYVPLLVKACSRGISGSNLQHERWQLATSNLQHQTSDSNQQWPEGIYGLVGQVKHFW